MIKIVCVGKIKESFYKEAIAEYVKRISKYQKLTIVELPDFDYDKVKTIYEEEKLIVNNLDKKDYIISLCIEGKKVDSKTFSNILTDSFTTKSNITFVIGGSYGLGEKVKQMSDLKLSFSDLTFPHQLFRVILLEQIYRGFKIINNESYHK